MHSPHKSASLIVYYFDNDEWYKRLFQNAQIHLEHARKGYDKVVLLKSRNAELPFGTAPDVIDSPTNGHFFNQIVELAKDDYYIDIFIFAHGSYKGFNLEDKKVSISDSAQKGFRNKTGLRFAPIRIVYQINCYGYYLMEGFRSFGAKAVCGSRYVNFYPNTFNDFAVSWNEGNVSFKDAIIGSNKSSSRTVMQSLVWLHAKSMRNWRSCNVLGSNNCAKQYFIQEWFLHVRGEPKEDQWQEGKSGKQNMNHSSWLRRIGDKDITKNTRPAWPTWGF